MAASRNEHDYLFLKISVLTFEKKKSTHAYKSQVAFQFSLVCVAW